ncbi:MAG TPA: ribonuclease T [Thiotrichaceae bacterium]|nr:ribonuclease T [Thiotrichaceae bacterium]
MNDSIDIVPIQDRFRGFLPVVIDMETGGFDKEKDALLEVAAVILRIDEKGEFRRHRTFNWHIAPFEGSNLDPKSLEVNGIDVNSPFRQQIAIGEHKAMAEFFNVVRKEVKLNNCSRAILVGHNANFDLGFLNTAAERTGIKRNPFHPFSTFDTVTLGAMAYGQTVLARIANKANIPWDTSQAHSASYDAEKTADIFCKVLNSWLLLNSGMDMLVHQE